MRELFETVDAYAKDAPDAVFKALQHTHWLISRMPAVRGFRECYGSSWPALMLSEEERVAAYIQLKWLVMRVESDEVLLPQSPISPREMAMVDDVMDVFKSCCVGRHVARDWSIINLLAIELTPWDVAKRQRGEEGPRVTPDLVEERKLCQCAAIAFQLRYLMDTV